jgi:hypothetical protein
MTRAELEHIIRAAAGNVNARDIVVIGSQSILGSYPDAPSASSPPEGRRTSRTWMR